MTDTESGSDGLAAIWRRELAHYPSDRRRLSYLALVVVATIVLYWQQYVGGSVGPAIQAHFHISFRYALTVTVISSAVGAVASLLAGIADRVGRANMVVGGLLAASLMTSIAIPAAGSAPVYAVFSAVVGFVEGVVLVVTPALVRDFSPQMNRGRAMGAWALGPVIASLCVAEVASHTLNHLRAWEDQFHIAGIVGLVLFAATMVWLRELSPQLRDQRMASLAERVLVEARARGVDPVAATRRPWRQVFQLDVVVPALGISLFLLIYYSAVAFFVLYFSSVFGFSTARSNSLGNWFWAADAVAVVLVGAVSDRLLVRKPFILAGALVAIALTVVFAGRATHPSTSSATFATILVFLSASRGVAYAPWMAAFTETEERHNPALVAAGLAVWAWIVRVVVTVAFLILPSIVTSATALVDYGPQVKAISARYPDQVATLQAIAPATRAALESDPASAAARLDAVRQIAAARHVPLAVAVADLRAAAAIPTADRTYLQDHGDAVNRAHREAPGQWRDWWWICVGGQVALLPTIFLLKGRWRPALARRDADEHRQRVEAEMAAFRGGVPVTGVAAT